MRDSAGVQMIVREIETHITTQKVKLIHLNDSRGERGSGIDRHEHIGLGRIGLTGLRHFIQSRPFGTIPLILETPKKQDSDDPRNLRMVRKMLLLKR